MNLKAISLNVGRALLVSALFMLLCIVMSIMDGYDSGFTPLVISFIITLIVGGFPFIFVRKAQVVTLRDGFLTIVFSWLLSFVFGMLPYVLWGGEFTLINAWFESVSGYTTTGSTILQDVEALPRSLILWRSSTHFIGGLGVVVFLLLVMPDASPYRLKLANMELSTLSKEGYRYKSSKTISIITTIYLCMASVFFLSLWAAGMSSFDALNHAFSIAATGGFSSRNLSIAFFQSDFINVLVMVFMAVAAMHFGLIYAVFAMRSFKPMNNAVVKYYFGSIVVMSIAIMISLKTQGGYETWGRALMDSSFTVVSYMTTTGFGICDNSSWPWIAGIVLMVASFQCGCAGSTTGGIKVDRVLITLRALRNEVKRRLHPSLVSNLRMGATHLSAEDVSSVFMYIVMYFIVIFISIIAVLLCGTDLTEAVSGVVASVGSVGPGIAEIGCMDNYAAQPAMAKFIYAFDMFLGRVEIYPILIVISMLFKRRS